MELLSHLLKTDPAAPRLTVYDETTGARLDFSAHTLDNWAAKVANMLNEEFDLGPGAKISIQLPVGWQAVVIALGAMAAEIAFQINTPCAEKDVTFTTLEAARAIPPGEIDSDICVVTNDTFGRGVVETGQELPENIIDFAPTVRVYGDHYAPLGPRLAHYPTRYDATTRLLSTGWHDTPSFSAQVLEPLAGGGSAVIVTGLANNKERLTEIITAEKTTHCIVKD
ncbi:TIGR03089 family protein [Corynebacterium caspium]|uniref:TIGR03089 family protein n=1 Tax=Corynebacterium caspium TaxID=234828 RepID=UPI0003718D46|nr:TIGR03089 family protein [Corynebacterium caspium]WKD59730.1 hypothetical protein CCASP_06755 [Corynebacterium caspium DSM 44850]